MIQILGYREYFNKTKQIWDVKHQMFDVHAKDVPDLFANYTHYVGMIPDDERFNLHYTVARCYEAPRLFKEQSTIPFDLDDIDIAQLDSYISIVEEITGVSQEEMGITMSGHGLHFLIETEHVLKSEEELKSLQPAYKHLCSRLDARMKDSGLIGKTDKGVFRPAGTLRLPGTQNRPFYKRDEHLKHKLFEPVQAYVINNKILPQKFSLLDGGEAALHEVVTHQELRQFPRPDTEFVIKSCNFLKWNFEHPEEVSEPEWYAALSIVGVLDNGRDLAHAMSKGHPSYDYTTTDVKLTQAMAASGPRTCSNIDSLSDKCRACKFFGQVTSPVVLRGPDYIKTLDTGFWNVGVDSKGKPKKGTPNYEDLRRFFEKKHKYISLPSGAVFVWKNTHWVEYEDIFLRSFAQDHFDPKPTTKEVNEFVALVKRTNTRAEDFFDESTIGRINLANGVLKLDEMELEPHDSKYGFKYCLSHQYDPAATCPRFDTFMKEITTNREDLSSVLMEYAAYSFSGMPYVYQKALMMSGEGANGKSTFIAVLKKLAGKDSFSSLMLNELDQEYKRAYMVGKLFNVAEETPVRSLGDSSWFKVLSAGGSYMAREIYKKPVNVVANRTKLIMACNELPDMTDFSEGFMRRLIIVPFDAKFSADLGNVDPQIEEKLFSELPGIFNRVVEAYHRLLTQNGFTKSEVVTATIKEYKDMQNTAMAWFGEHAEKIVGKGVYTPASSLYRAYSEWCKGMSIRPVTTTKFGTELKRLTGKNSYNKKVDGKVIRIYDDVKLLVPQAGDFMA
jgi:P4 family phage/plasmid primase-like protien